MLPGTALYPCKDIIALNGCLNARLPCMLM